MSKAGALDLASGLGGQIDKGDVPSAVEKYEKYHVFYGGEEEARKANYTDMVNKYYDLVTSFYEFGWGESFHFAPRWKNETLKESIKRHEHFLALQLALKPGQKVYLATVIEEESNKCHSHFTSLAVLRTHRKLGLATKLMNAAQNAMEQVYGAEYVSLYVRKSNRAAFNLYTETLGNKIHDVLCVKYRGRDEMHNLYA